MTGTDRAPIIYLPDGTPVKVRLIGAACEGDVSGEGHYGYNPRDLDGEDPTVYFEGVPSVECVHCGDDVAQALIEDHHVNDHPMKRWNPAFYPEVFEDAERTQEADTGLDDSEVRTDGDGDRLKYLNNGQLREEIAYTVGGDPTRYGADSDRGLNKVDLSNIALELQPEDSEIVLEELELVGLYESICEWAGGEYQSNAGNAWGLNRENLKQIHRSIDAQPPREVVSA